MKLTINNKDYEVIVVESDEDKAQGLQGITQLAENEGMLFVYDEPCEVGYWMKSTLIPLDIIFIDDEDTVISVHQGEPNDETPITEDDVSYVLELNVNSGIKAGDEVEFEDDDKLQIKNQKMYVLDEHGRVQMTLDGGERIISRKQTVTTLKKAHRAYSSQEDRDYVSLGNYVFKVIAQQEKNEPEFVELPD